MIRFTVCALLIWALVKPASAGAQAISVASKELTQVPANVSSPPSLISVNFAGIRLAEAIRTIVDRSGVSLTYDAATIPTRDIKYSASRVTAEQALIAVTTNTGLKVIRGSANRLVLVSAKAARQAKGVVAGRVIDAKTGRGIPGASISIGNDAEKSVTVEDGSYRLAGVAAGTHTLTVRLVGYAKQTRSVTVGEGVTVTENFKLEPSANVLDQVIVTGTVVASEIRSVPNAITVVTVKQIEERGITRIDQLFRGDIPGLFAQNQGSGALLDEVTMFSRGATALSANEPLTGVFTAFTNPIKTYIDGVELADSKFLSQIDPRSIERIEILTGPQASTIYGSNAINGVMQIFTKRGMTSRPQLTLNLISGWVENNFSNARTPQHDYSAQVNSVEGRASYNAGGSWNYIGPWTPAKQTVRTGGFGGARFDVPIGHTSLTADVTLRRTITQNRERGSAQQTETGYHATGWFTQDPAFTFAPGGLSQPTTHSLTGQTLGFVLGYVPTSWWSHELGMGIDAADREQRQTARGYVNGISDTTLFLSQSHTDRRSLRYATTARIPVTSRSQATVTLGTDAWQNLTSSMSVSPQTLSGSLTGTTSVSRRPGHNTGSFLQTQLGIKDRLFFTYGLRAEWNPTYGDEAQPNIAPRYGVAYTQELGPVTAKLRGSYGRSTRPPAATLKTSTPIGPLNVPFWGSILIQLANPDLAPEHQQGGEGGMELYIGTHGSLVITRYNQTVDGLISSVRIDSVDLLPQIRSQFGIPAWASPQYQSQYLNIGSIRNQGWEMQGSAQIGPMTTRGTYSWTKSRTIGVTPKYRALFTPAVYPQFQSGATFQYLPEHTWALGITYARAATTLGLNVTGVGQLTNVQNDFYFQNLHPFIRLSQNRLNVTTGRYVNFINGYSLADMTASHRFLPRVEGVIQGQNLTDRYTNDRYSGLASMGRQFKVGFRLR